MITENQYNDHILTLGKIYNSRGQIKSISRLEDKHKKAKKHKKINFNFVKKRTKSFKKHS